MDPKDPKSPPDLDEFDLSPEELKARRAAFKEGPTQPSPRPQRQAAALDEFDAPFRGTPSTPVQLPPKSGHIRIPAGTIDPGADPSTRKPTTTLGARARADDHRTHAAKGAGPSVFRLFHRLLALNFLFAFWSLRTQIDVLIGPRGLMPMREFIDVVRMRPDAGFAQFPTFFLWGTQEAWISGGLTLGIGLSIAAMLGVLPRILLAVLVPLYLGYATVCHPFLSFQWDSLLIEAGFLAILLPRDIRSPVLLLGFRLLLFKLYFESGLAKWQSHLADWQDGSAMLLYYQTAPLPTPLAWFAHHLPAAWHHLEAYGALALELIVPFFILGPRGLRRVAFLALTGFQLVNFATANYGFFITLSLALHVFLLDDADLRAAGALVRSLFRLPGKLRVARADWRPSGWRTLGSWAAFAVVLAWAALSTVQGVDRFVEGRRSESAVPGMSELTAQLAPFRVVNNYHLFGHITRQRVEPEFQTLQAGVWRSHHLKYKPGRPGQAGPWVAPHQPRVDFRLWFYGLSYEQRTPQYVETLLRRICHDPSAVQALFARPLPERPVAVRVRFLDYKYTDWATRRETGDWWVTDELGSTSPRACSDAVGLGAAARSEEEER